MKMFLRKFWNDEVGMNVSLETAIVGTVTTLGVVGGLTQARDAVNAELGDFAGAIRSFDQSYEVSGYSSTGTIQVGTPGCLNNTNNSTNTTAIGTSYLATKAGSGFQQASSSVSQIGGSAQFNGGGNIAGRNVVLRTTGRIDDDSEDFVREAPRTVNRRVEETRSFVQPAPRVVEDDYVLVPVDRLEEVRVNDSVERAARIEERAVRGTQKTRSKDRECECQSTDTEERVRTNRRR